MENIGSLYESKVIPDKIFPIHMFQNIIPENRKYFDNHWHEHMELHYIVSGCGTMVCNNKKIKVVSNDLIIFNSNELHEGYAESIDFKAMVLIFDLTDLSMDMESRHLIFQNLISKDKRIKSLFFDIFKEDEEKKIGYKIAMKGKIHELIAYLMRNYVIEQLTLKDHIKRNKNLDRLNNVLQYIQDNYQEDISLTTLSKVCNLSEFRFSHLFKETLGQSPMNYLISFRLKTAYKMLQRGEFTVAEVSQKVGFNNFNNFGRLFRNHYGMSPSRVINLPEVKEGYS